MVAVLIALIVAGLLLWLELFADLETEQLWRVRRATEEEREAYEQLEHARRRLRQERDMLEHIRRKKGKT